MHFDMIDNYIHTTDIQIHDYSNCNRKNVTEKKKEKEKVTEKGNGKKRVTE